MDLSVEAEAFGARVVFSDTEVPTVVGRLLTGEDAVEALRVPDVGAGRTSVYLEAVRRLAETAGDVPVIAGMIGPFSLAARLFGVSEALLETAADPEMIERLVARVTPFLASYAAAFREAGGNGVIIAEPSAGLLSPAGLSRFSSPYVRSILERAEGPGFECILHNCGARAIHLDAIKSSGAGIYHFGAPMDIVQALSRMGPGALVCGNLDPAAVFVHATVEEVAERTRTLLAATRGFRNFVISSGCDLPAETPLEHLDAFLRETRDAALNAQGRG
jgi:uroporphyrinogen decarboxylase